MYRCIGLKRVKRHATDSGELIQCTAQSETPTNPNRPEWGWLCSACANAPANGPRPVEGPSNVGAMQCDAEEYKDQINAAFLRGVSRREYSDGSDPMDDVDVNNFDGGL